MNDYSFLEFMWTLIVIYALFVLIMILFSIVVDLFRDHELSGVAKAGWIILLIVLPLIGILIYVITRHDGMQQRALERRQAEKAEFDSYVKSAAGTGGSAQEIADAKSLLDSGAITQDEYEALKAKALS